MENLKKAPGDDEDGNEIDEPYVAVLSLGSKATGRKFIRKDGLHLNDCHSEVLSRRGLIKWLQFELEHVFDKKDGDKLFKKKDGILFHLYVSEVPCGDASMGILPYLSEEEK